MSNFSKIYIGEKYNTGKIYPLFFVEGTQPFSVDAQGMVTSGSRGYNTYVKLVDQDSGSKPPFDVQVTISDNHYGINASYEKAISIKTAPTPSFVLSQGSSFNTDINSFTIGTNCSNLGRDSIVVGEANHALPDQTSANNASDLQCHSNVALGRGCRAQGRYAQAQNLNTIANFSQTVVGTYNKPLPHIYGDNLNYNGALFIVGNGTNWYTGPDYQLNNDRTKRSNALEVWKDGSVRIGKIEPTQDNDLITLGYLKSKALPPLTVEMTGGIFTLRDNNSGNFKPEDTMESYDPSKRFVLTQIARKVGSFMMVDVKVALRKEYGSWLPQDAMNYEDKTENNHEKFRVFLAKGLLFIKFNNWKLRPTNTSTFVTSVNLIRNEGSNWKYDITSGYFPINDESCRLILPYDTLPDYRTYGAAEYADQARNFYENLQEISFSLCYSCVSASTS